MIIGTVMTSDILVTKRGERSSTDFATCWYFSRGHHFNGNQAAHIMLDLQSLVTVPWFSINMKTVVRLIMKHHLFDSGKCHFSLLDWDNVDVFMPNAVL